MRRTRLLLLSLVAAVAALLATALTGTAVAATNTSPGPFPLGTNVPCPAARHPYPVVLVHGTFENAAQNWASLAPYLQAQGYCVFALNYGLNGTQDIAKSAQQLKDFIEKFVLPTTGASKVDVVGHSQGGMMPRYYIKYLGGTATINELVGLSPSNHGTTVPPARYAVGCRACMQQVYDSPFLRDLNNPYETYSPVDYTVLET